MPTTAGNVAIFCQTNDEWLDYNQLAQPVMQLSKNPAQKYFQLRQPIEIPANDGIPATRLTWLYIRRPALDSPEAGDIDYVLPQAQYDQLKERVTNGKLNNATAYIKPGWDMIEIRNLKYDGLAYVTVQDMAEKVRIQF